MKHDRVLTQSGRYTLLGLAARATVEMLPGKLFLSYLMNL